MSKKNAKPKFDVGHLVAQAHGEPVNAVSGRPYTGKNVGVLLVAMDEGEYDKPIFMTLSQANFLGRKIKKDEKSCATIVRWVTPKDAKGKKTPKGKKGKRKLVPTYHAMFNIDQTEEYKKKEGKKAA
jgi:antirestriction protein ArdC